METELFLLYNAVTNKNRQRKGNPTLLQLIMLVLALKDDLDING